MKEPIVTVVYSHGRFGSPWYGFKIEALRPVALANGANMISVRYPETMGIQDMEEALFAACSDEVRVPGDLVFLSSSRGAYLSTRVSNRLKELYDTEENRLDEDKALPRRHVLGQFLIAPAFFIKPEYYPDQDPKPATMRTTIVHGFDDDVIDAENSIRFAREHHTQLYLIEGGHRLNSQRARLCMLFESFLGDCKVDAHKTFEEWLALNKRNEVAPD